MDFNLFPWNNDIKPDWVNPENGYEWYRDKDTTDWCTRDMLNGNPKLNATCFYIVEVNEDESRKALTRMLIDNKTNEPLYENGGLEDMAVHIDMLRVAMLFDENES